MKALANYLFKREAAIQAILKKPKRNYSPKTFHKLRTEIKKLNALLDLITFSTPALDREKTFKPFRQIFRLAGKVRELQLEDAMFKKYLHKDTLKRYRKQLKKRRAKAQKAFFKLANNSPGTRLKRAFQKIRTCLSAVTKKHAAGYLETSKTSIKKILSRPELEVGQVHELRKKVKAFIYNGQGLHPKKKFKEETDLSELLGKWHDCQVIVSQLNRTVRNKAIAPEERSQLEKVRTKLAAKSGKLLRKINTALASSKTFKAGFTNTGNLINLPVADKKLVAAKKK